MDYNDFEFPFNAFEDAEPGIGVEDAQDAADPFNRDDEVYNALGLDLLSFCPDQQAATPAPDPLPSHPLDDIEFCFDSHESESGLFGSPEVNALWAFETLDFPDPLFTPPAAVATSPESSPSSPPFSPDSSSSPPSSASDSIGPSDSSPRSPAWTYDSFTDGVSYDDKLREALQEAIDNIAIGLRPTKEQVLAFVLPGPKAGFVCAVDSCEWHRIGWKREDRGISHVLKEHFKVLNFPCDDCHRVYKWPHDLTKHRLLKHSNPGDKPPPQYMCPESLCGQVFDKSYNLNRHRRNVHRKSGRTSKAKTRREH